MATNIVLIDSQTSDAADTLDISYTSPADSLGTIITAFTATNNTGSNRTFKAYIFNASGLVLQSVIPLTIIIRNKFNPGSGIVNHLIPAGGTLKIESDLADSIVFRVSGKVL